MNNEHVFFLVYGKGRDVFVNNVTVYFQKSWIELQTILDMNISFLTNVNPRTFTGFSKIRWVLSLTFHRRMWPASSEVFSFFEQFLRTNVNMTTLLRTQVVLSQ